MINITLEGIKVGRLWYGGLANKKFTHTFDYSKDKPNKLYKQLLTKICTKDGDFDGDCKISLLIMTVWDYTKNTSRFRVREVRGISYPEFFTSHYNDRVEDSLPWHN